MNKELPDQIYQSSDDQKYQIENKWKCTPKPFIAFKTTAQTFKI